MFEPLKFEGLNETDVREEVIAPLLRALGYRSGTDNNVIREQLLRYPKAFLGRKNPQKDPPLRGKADYILEVQRAVRWVIEAKAPDVEINVDEIEQAWSYANHPEVRAVYFALCNGRRFDIFQTNLAPDHPPLLSIAYEEFVSAFPRLKNVIGPEALLRDHPRQAVDIGDPLGPGLRSVARITNGLIRYERSSLAVPVLGELQISIAEGAVERDDEKRLVAYVRTISPIRSFQIFNERLGLTAFEMVSPDQYLSVDSTHPTCFQYQNHMTFPAGESVLDLNTWRHVVLPRNIRFTTLAQASGILVDRVFRGTFTTHTYYVDIGKQASLSGSFEAHLA